MSALNAPDLFMFIMYCVFASFIDCIAYVHCFECGAMSVCRSTITAAYFHSDKLNSLLYTENVT